MALLNLINSWWLKNDYLLIINLKIILKMRLGYV